MHCGCKLGETCGNYDRKYQYVDWKSPSGKMYRRYLDMREFYQLFPKSKLEEGDDPMWSCIQGQFYKE